jgi:probable HAF family extracellular repeat protein
VGLSGLSQFSGSFATEWSDGRVIDLGGLPGSTRSAAFGINDVGQVVGYSVVGGVPVATEWSDGRIIALGGLQGSVSSIAYGINHSGQIAEYSLVGGVAAATEWSQGVINLGAGVAKSINDLGQAVGSNGANATEWTDGRVIDLKGLPGSTAAGALGINDVGEVVGYSEFPTIPAPPSALRPNPRRRR